MREAREIVRAASELLGMTIDEFADLCRREAARQLRMLAIRMEDNVEPTPGLEEFIDANHWAALANAAEIEWSEDAPDEAPEEDWEWEGGDADTGGDPEGRATATAEDSGA